LHRFSHHWVADTEQPVTVKWAQELYWIDGFADYADGFSPARDAQVVLIPHDEYYAPAFRSTADDVVLPDSLSRLLLAYSELERVERRRFLRACMWLQVAERSWDYSMSTWFTALVSSLETLVLPSGERCSKCGSVVGETRSFKEFVAHYSPSSEPAVRDSIYEMRSTIAHGSAFLEADAAPWASSPITPDRVLQLELMDDLVTVVRETIVNWLLEAHAASA
jgi:hypothetical protein